ncbi:hypothetical protein DS745_20245 [Anaerobacillus alkaliphilus]|uniref:Uncharacterized protein n=1 Tax=Anaerobacillus alkaliphilus TaxID=1548597 RepID=A0A4Q0VQW7_9BACI|nr:hypothetical protein [Anaerobacillus alkaliphilus]RXI98648.1 hypothetical protein DS745_20245 [Anaerobacillus alkaliphilus]
MKKLGFMLICFLCVLLVACGNNDEATNESKPLITFLNETITEKDAENAKVSDEETLEDAANDLLFQEMLLAEAEKAGITYDEFTLDALVDQTHQIFEYDQEAITFLTAKSKLYNITPKEYIDTIWKDGLRKKLIANNYLMEYVDLTEGPESDIEAQVETIRTELLTKYEDQIEFHF